MGNCGKSQILEGCYHGGVPGTLAFPVPLGGTRARYPWRTVYPLCCLSPFVSPWKRTKLPSASMSSSPLQFILLNRLWGIFEPYYIKRYLFSSKFSTAPSDLRRTVLTTQSATAVRLYPNFVSCRSKKDIRFPNPTGSVISPCLYTAGPSACNPLQHPVTSDVTHERLTVLDAQAWAAGREQASRSRGFRVRVG